MNANFTLRLLIQTLVVLISTIVAEAASLTAEQALQRVQSSGPVFKAPGNKHFTLGYTEKVADENLLYVFNNGDNGFIIASGDDRMPPLLGYSDNGQFDKDNVSPEFKWWLSQYAEEANAVFKSYSSKEYVYSNAASEKENIPKLLTTEWNQNAPYNQNCPVDGWKRSVTGCMATAMAQVIKYHEYPTTGKGFHSYAWKGTTLSYDYSTATFDYANMLDKYDSTATQTQKDAVANLMYACGVSVDMDYSSTESGARSIAGVRALSEYFNFNSHIEYLQKAHYAIEEWNELVYKELQEGRPVLYTGSSDIGGHAFVCDGYENGYFHINWGWGGNYDGWFLLSALNPEGQGIGGYEGGYNSYQGIICGAQPNAGKPQIDYSIFSSGGFSGGDVVGNSYVTLNFQKGKGVYNYSSIDIETSFFLQGISPNGDQFISNQEINLTFPRCDSLSWGYNKIEIYLPSAPIGDYKTYVVYKGPDGELHRLRFPKNCKDYLYMSVDEGGNYSFYQGSDISVTDLALVSKAILGKSADFSFTVQNNGDRDYSGPLYLRFIDPVSLDVTNEKSVNVTVNQGQSLNSTFSIMCDMQPGEYYLQCYDMYGNLCFERFDFEVEEEVPSILSAVLMSMGDVFSYTPSDFIVGFENIGDIDYEGDFEIRVFDKDSGETEKGIIYHNLGLKAKDSVAYMLTLNFDLPAGEYTLQCYDKDGLVCSGLFPLTILDNTNIPDLRVTDFTPLSELYTGEISEFSINLQNDGTYEYNGALSVYVYEHASEEYIGGFAIDIPKVAAGETLETTIKQNLYYPVGEYDLVCHDMFGNPCSDTVPILIKSRIPEPSSEILEANLISWGDVFKSTPACFSLQCNNIGSSDYSGKLTIKTFNSNGELMDNHIFDYNYYYEPVLPGKDKRWRIELNFDLPVGDYVLQCYDMNDKPCSEVLPIVVKDNSILPQLQITDLSPYYKVCTGEFSRFSMSLKNIGNVDYNGGFGVEIYSHESENILVIKRFLGYKLTPGEELSDWHYITFDSTDNEAFPPGEYDLRCIDMFGNPCSDILTVEIVNREDLPESEEIKVELELISDVYANQLYHYFIDIKNIRDKEYSGCCYIRAYDAITGEKVSEKLQSGITLSAGESDIWRDWSVLWVSPGLYNIQCYDKDGYPCSEIIQIEVKDDSVLPELHVSAVSSELGLFSGENQQFNVSLKNDGDADYFGVLYTYIYDSTTDELVYWFFDWYVRVSIGEEQDQSYNFLNELPIGEYSVLFYDMFGNPCGDELQLVVRNRDELPSTIVTPAITFEDGTVTINCETADSEIHYTLDGTDPTAASTLYEAPFALTRNATVKAIALIPGLDIAPSEIAELVVDSYKVNAPTSNFEVATRLLTLSCDTVDAAISYALERDGEWHAYSEPIRLRKNCTVFAKATLDGYNDSDIAEIVIDQLPDSVVAPAIAFADGTVTITCETADVEIHYTLDGTDPTAASTLYEAPFALARNATVKSIALIPDLDINPSEISELVVDSYSVATPTGVFDVSTRLLTLSCATEGAAVQYTFDSEGEWSAYTAPIAITRNCTVYARASLDGYSESEIAEIVIDQLPDNVDAPVIAFADGTVTITCETAEAEIRYTLDGTNPTENSTLYQAPFALGYNATVKAIALIPDLDINPSEIAEFVVDSYKVSNPSGTFDSNARQLTLSCPAEGASIFYAFDRAGEWLTYSGPVAIDGNCTVYVKATLPDFNDSDIVEIVIADLKCAGTSFRYNGRYLTIATDEPDARILYTADGSDPSNGIQYVGEFDVTGLCNVRAVAVRDRLLNSEEGVFQVDRYADEDHAETAAAGLLASAFEWNPGLPNSVDTYRVEGHLNDADFTFLRSMQSLRHLDIERVAEARIPAGAFKGTKLITLSLPENIAAYGEAILADAPLISSLIWNSKAAPESRLTDGIANPNLLIYLPEGTDATALNGLNVVSAERAASVTLHYGYPYHAARDFRADRVSMTREFRQETQIGECQGWETIVLPFAPESISHEANGPAVPFAAWNGDTRNGPKPFWLYGSVSEGWEEAKSIEPGVPYIISMPNNREYVEANNLAGKVTFSAENVDLGPESNYALSTPWREGTEFEGTFMPVDEDGILTLNVGDTGGEYLPGSTFVPAGPAVPFSAYVWGAAGRKAMPVFGDSSSLDLPTLSGDGLLIETPAPGVLKITSSRQRKVAVTTVTGVTLRTLNLLPGETVSVEGLTRDLYIVAGQKVFVK